MHDFTDELKNEINSPDITSYYFSPSTIQYIYQSYDILTKFTHQSDKKEIKIVEIGGGYGGLFKIMKDVAPLFGITIKHYTIIDLPDVTKHQKFYLEKLGVTDFSVVPSNESDVKNINASEYDLLISIYALGEFSHQLCEFYTNTLTKHIPHLYLWWNMTEVHEYYDQFPRETTGILHDHPAGKDIKIYN